MTPNPNASEVTLKPCPRCGSRAFITGVDSYSVWCVQDNCLQLPPRSSRAEAVTAWNTRLASQASTDRPTSELVELARQAVETLANRPLGISLIEWSDLSGPILTALDHITTLEAKIAGLQAAMREARKWGLSSLAYDAGKCLDTTATFDALLSDAEDRGACTMGVGCDEAGVCYADAHGEPEQCPKAHPARDEQAVGEGLAVDFEIAYYKSTPAEMWEWIAENYDAILTALRAKPADEVNAVFEAPDGPVMGQTAATVKRVERQDDGSLTVVIDHWPQTAKPADIQRNRPSVESGDEGSTSVEGLRELLREAGDALIIEALKRAELDGEVYHLSDFRLFVNALLDAALEQSK